MAAAAGLVAMAMVAGAAPAAAQNPLGTAVAVRPTAEGELGGTRVTLVDGNTLFQGQTIATDTTGEVQILFADDTRMVVGPNSTLIIETYLLQNANTVGNLTVNALGGSFRFISGNSPSANYHINTPTGTIGLRGTKLDFTVDPVEGLVYIIVYEGQVFFCNLAGVCVDLEARCQVGVMGEALAEVITQQRPRFAISRAEFMYAISQWRLLDPFQVEDPRECLFATAAGAGSPPPSPSPSGDDSSSGSGSGGSGGSGSEGPPSKGSKGGSYSSGPGTICEAILNNAYDLPIPQWVYTYCFGPGK
ncbi:MAG: FecR domain-containing protein [Bauldia sp.]|nr:FecR domain-containing protein [Bauldia sp.]